MRVTPTSRGTPFPPPSSRGGILSLRDRERIPDVPVASQEEALSTGKARGTQESCHHSQSPADVSVYSRKTCFPALPRLSSRGSNHSTVARGTTLWESLVGNPRGKPRGKATDSLIHAKGSVTSCYSSGGKQTCMPPLSTRTDSPAESSKVRQDPCQHWRGLFSFRHRLHTRS